MTNKTLIITLLLLIAITTNTFGQDENSHEYLFEHNAIYKANYKHTEKLFNAKAGSICGKILVNRKLTENERKAYLMYTYYGWIILSQKCTTKAKRSFLILYDKVYWNNATEKQVETEFARLMNNIKEEMKINESLKKVPMPYLDEIKVDIDDL